MASPSEADATTEVALRYFGALQARDPDAMAACWQPGAIDRFHGQEDLNAPEDVRRWFGELFAAFPDATFEVISTTAQDDRCAVRWKLTGTFAGPGRFQGIEPNGSEIELQGCDVVRVEDGLLVGNDAYMDSMSVARQLGLLPPRDSGAERSLTAMANGRTRLAMRFSGNEPEAVADGVWVVRGGLPRVMNVYFLRDGHGVCLFDAGVASMTPKVAAVGARLGGITRIVLGHADPDHRGTAPALGAPVSCHPLERAAAEGDGGVSRMDFSKLDFPARLYMPFLLRMWDGGPVEVAETLEEGDEVAGFRVIHLPGHTAGLIGLWRESDRLALASDCFYVIDPQTGKPGGPRVPHVAFDLDVEQARASIRKLAALAPATAWSGHHDPLRGDVAAQLEHAAATT